MEEQLTLTNLFEPVDELDRFILNDILTIVQNTQVLPAVSYWGHEKLKLDKADEQFFLKIAFAVGALLKANAHVRNYKQIEARLLKEIDEYPEHKGTNVDILYNKVDAFVEIEGFLTYFKTTLDLLAQSLQPIFGIRQHTWEHKIDKESGKRVSGQVILNELNNLSKDMRPNAQALIDFSKPHLPYLTKFVALRDSALHYGRIKDVQGFRYSASKKQAFPPVVLITNSDAAYVHDYLSEGMKYIAEFTQEFVVIVLSNLLPDMKIGKRSDGSWGYFSKGGEIQGIAHYKPS